MKRIAYSKQTALALTLGAALVISFWLLQTHFYSEQGMSFNSMLKSEFSHENSEWKSAYWAAIYPLISLALAAIYTFTGFAKSRPGALSLALAGSVLALSAPFFIHWLPACILLIPCLLGWRSAATA